jgi:hypothetical protein
MSGKVTGKVHFIDETKEFGQRGFRKRMVVLEQENGQFTNYIPVEFLRDACDTVNDLSVGDEIEVTYQLAGRKWQRDPNSEVKYFLNAEATSFRSLSGAAPAAAGGMDDQPPPDEEQLDEEDVPF